MIVNGMFMVMEIWEGVFVQGEFIIIDFVVINVDLGVIEVVFEVMVVNGLFDYN